VEKDPGTLLDDPGSIARRDPGGMFGLLAGWPGQWRSAAARAKDAEWPEGPPAGGFQNLVISGMGGSAIGGDLLNACLGDALGIPLVVNRSDACPGFVGPGTLFVAVSYSGETEETLSAAAEALGRGAEVVGVTSGGALASKCSRAGKAVFTAPGGLPPRQALAHLFLPMLGLVQALGLADDQSTAVEETGQILSEAAGLYGPAVPAAENPAKRLAFALHGKIPVVYGVQGRTAAAATRWRDQFHENSKNWAAANALPELDHNEIASWHSLSALTRRVVCVIFLEDPEDGARMARRRQLTRDAIAPHVAGAFSVPSRGRSRLARLFSLVVQGDFVSGYLAVLNEADPLPVPAIDDLKTALAADSPKA
jgi:glucose/mannose-6-phosphate isomerase